MFAKKCLEGEKIIDILSNKGNIMTDDHKCSFVEILLEIKYGWPTTEQGLAHVLMYLKSYLLIGYLGSCLLRNRCIRIIMVMLKVCHELPSYLI